MIKNILSIIWLLIVSIQLVSAYTPSTEFQIKIETTTKTLDTMLEERWENYRASFLRVINLYKLQYNEDEKASYILDYISNNLKIMKHENCIVFDDFSIDEKNNWIIVNDWVMGGLSKWNILTENETMIFSGNINTNGGWFTSIRASLSDWVLKNTTHILLHAKADSRSYKMTFRDRNNRWIGHQIQIPFQTPWIFEEIKISLAELSPTYFGRNISAAGFQKDEGREMWFIISDGINWGFQLEIESIRFCEG